MRDTHTPPRSIRVPNERWDAAKAKAAAEGRTITDVINEALQRYIMRRPPGR
jgi:predicted DNA binding CopG/RHH family protein